MRRKAAFNKSLIKGKQRGCRLSSSLSLDYLSFFLFFIFPCFSRIPDRSSFSVSRLLVYPRHARLISPLSFSVFYARRDYVAGQNMGYRGREEGRGKKEEERRKERFEKRIAAVTHGWFYRKLIRSLLIRSIFFFEIHADRSIFVLKALARARTQVIMLFV